MEDVTIQVDGWFEQKVVGSLVHLSRAAWHAKKLMDIESKSELPPNSTDDCTFIAQSLYGEIYGSLYDLTKVASTLSGEKIWSWADRDEIVDKGEEGLANVLDRYGFSGWLPSFRLQTSKMLASEKANEQNILRRVRELSEGEMGGNRTEIYSELKKIESQNSEARHILDLLEPVSQGEKEWSEFQKEMKQLPINN